MQYTYEEAVREISDFLGKTVTADNYWKMEQVLLTVLRGKETKWSDFDRGYDAGYKRGYEDGVAEERDSWICK